MQLQGIIAQAQSHLTNDFSRRESRGARIAVL